MRVPIIVVHIRHAATMVQMSRMAGADVRVLLDQLEAEARTATEKVLGDSRLRWSVEVREGMPADELIAAVRAHDARAIAIGGPEHNAVLSMLLGSVSSAPVHRAPQSVLVIRPSLKDPSTDA